VWKAVKTRANKAKIAETKVEETKEKKGAKREEERA